MLDLILRGASLLDRAGQWDVGLGGALVAQVDQVISEPALEVVDLGGRVLLPGFVDSHLHLDKAYLDEDPSLRGLTGAAFFEALKMVKQRRTRTELEERMRRALAAAARHGTTSIRAQIDVDDVGGLIAIQAALSLRRELSGVPGVQIVAFPQEGLVSNPRAMELMREALKCGAEVVGGGAAFDPVGIETHLQAVFDLALEFDADVDVHADLATDPLTPLDSWEIAHLARITTEIGWQGRVTVAHLTQLSRMPEERAAAAADLLAEAGVNVTVVPGAELNTATRWDSPAATHVDEAMSRLDILLSHGVNLSYATGHVADAFSPYGCGDMLLDGLVLACAWNLGGPRISGTHVLQLGSTNPARTLRLSEPYEIACTARADLVCLDATDFDRALRHHAPAWLIVRNGRVYR